MMTTTASLVPSQEQELPDSGPQNDPFNPVNHLTPHLDKRNSANVAEDFMRKATAAPRSPPPSYPLTDSQATLCGDDTFGGGSSSPAKPSLGGPSSSSPLKLSGSSSPPKLSLGSSPLAVPSVDQSISNSKKMIGKRKEKDSGDEKGTDTQPRRSKRGRGTHSRARGRPRRSPRKQG